MENNILKIMGGFTMDKNIKAIHAKKIDRTLKALQKNNMEARFIHSIDELVEVISQMVTDESTVAYGGSYTLVKLGLIDMFRNRNVKLLDRDKAGIAPEEKRRLQIEAFDSDFYFMSSNAITEDGELYNVDGSGNRVAALTYGPKNVVVIVGSNKIVRDIDEAVSRVERLAAPANCVRLNRKTPCVQTGVCMDCDSPERICNSYVVTKRQMVKDRVKVFILNDNYGY
jgi:L-lactate utilization protein LutC